MWNCRDCQGATGIAGGWCSQGALSAIVFLALNEYAFEAPEDDLVEMVYGVARREVEKADVALFMRRWSGKR